MINACIAGLQVQMTAADTSFFERRLATYRCEESLNPDLIITSRLVDSIPEAQGEILLRRNGLLLERRSDGRFCRYDIGKKTGRYLHAVVYDSEFFHSDISLYRDRKHRAFSLTDFEYVLTATAFSNRLSRLGGLVLHSSSIAFDGKGIAFSAPSGTGKSTHTALWKQRYGNRVTVINDDKPAIRFLDGRPYLFGTPWSGKTALNENCSAPLKALVFLRQAEKNALHTLSVQDAIFQILGGTVRPYYDEEIGIKTTETAARLIQTVPVYMLDCRPDTQAVELVSHELFCLQD